MPGSRTLLLKEEHQGQSNWCWAATAVSIALYYELSDLTQGQLVNEALGMSICCQLPTQIWNFEQLTGGGATGGPLAGGDPVVVSYHDQMHVCYRDATGSLGQLQHAWYDGQGNWLGQGNWHVQQLTGANPAEWVIDTPGPAAAGEPAVISYRDQMHVCYRDGGGLIQAAWYDGTWQVRQLTGGGAGAATNGPLAAGSPAVASYRDQLHVCYRDGDGLIQDVWYDGTWQLQQLTGAGASGTRGATAGPPAAGDPTVIGYHDQLHACYRDGDGLIQDVWYDGTWQRRQLTGGGVRGATKGPRAAGDPAVASYHDQLHVCYRDDQSNLQHAWYDGQGTWNLQQLTGASTAAWVINTPGPVAVGDPAVVSDGNQMHVFYRAGGGLIQHAWYDGDWNVWQLTAGGVSGGPPAAGAPTVLGFNHQLHVCYRDGDGQIQHAWDGSPCNVPWYPDRALTMTGHFAGETGPLSLSAGLSGSSVIDEIDNGRPISIRIVWNGGGGHNPAIVGYDTGVEGAALASPTIAILDPKFSFSIQDFDTFPGTYQGGGKWTTTYLTRPSSPGSGE